MKASWSAACRLAVALLSATPPALSAQQRLAEGRILKPLGAERQQPVAGAWIVLHRVGTDRAAPLDSVRSGRDGRFRFRYQRFGDPQALYFVSARFQGIAYFSPPLRADTVRGEDADIIVYETTTDSSVLRMQGRHLVVSSPRGEARDVAEIFEIANGGTQTVVARDSLTPVWSIGLPAAARNARVAPGDVTAAAVRFNRGRAEVFAPVSPGVRQLMITYQLPLDEASPSFPVQRDAEVLEVLLEEPRATAEAPGLQEVAPGVIEGRQFHRFLAQNAPASAVVRLTLPAPVGRNRSAVPWLGLGVAAAMVASLAVWAARARRQGPLMAPPGGAAAPHEAERLIAELATLDARFERDPAPTPGTRAAYERERSALKARIAMALAARDGVR